MGDVALVLDGLVGGVRPLSVSQTKRGLEGSAWLVASDLIFC